MDDIKRRDNMLFVKELLSPARIFLYLALVWFVWMFVNPSGVAHVVKAVIVALAVLSASTYVAWEKSTQKRFKSERFKLLWGACVDRHDRFQKGLKALSRKGVADLQELPKTIEAVANELYRALRRADIVANEVTSSEGWLVAQPRIGQAMSPDRQAQELYRLADKNIAEYRQQFSGVMAGVERTEAQVAVFTTTLDTLRMKMLSYRLVGKDTESPTNEFLAALTEARMQLDSIDKALEELDLTPFPRTVTIMPEADSFSRSMVDPGPPPIPPHILSKSQDEHIEGGQS